MPKKAIALIFVFLAWHRAAEAKLEIGPNAVDGQNVDDYLRYIRFLSVPSNLQDNQNPIWAAGNNTSGKTPWEKQTIASNIIFFLEDPIQKEISSNMISTPHEVFQFRDVDHAKSVVTQRMQTIAMIKSFNRDRQYDYQNPRTHPISTNAPGWMKGAGDRSYLFRQNGGNASDAILALCDKNRNTYGECLGAAIACVWWGAAQGMAKKTSQGTSDFSAFDTLYPGPTALNMNQFDSRNNSWARNTKLADVDQKIRVPGDWVYFKNYNFDSVVTDNRFTNVNYRASEFFWHQGWLTNVNSDGTPIELGWSGENAIYIGGGYYEGLGIPKIGETAMIEKLAGKYNKNLGHVISGLADKGGIYEGLKVKTIGIDADLSKKIFIEKVWRVKN